MTSKTDVSRPWLSIKRFALIIITILVGLVLGQSLINSWTQPQVANQLQLYQTDLLLQASTWSGEGLPDQQWQTIREGILGKHPLETAERQYKDVRQAATENIERTQTQLETETLANVTDASKPLSRRRQTALVQQQQLVNRLDIRLGLLAANQDHEKAAIQRWQMVVDSDSADQTLHQTAAALVQLWQDNTSNADLEPLLATHLTGWFRYRALEQLYQIEQNTTQLATLQQQEQTEAQSNLYKLALVGTLPVIGALAGSTLLIWLVVQRFTQGSQSVLMHNAGLGWNIPWNGETIWQVLVVGFFFVGQIVIPLVLSSLGLGFASLGSRGRALYSMIYYLLMAAGGLAVLWWSLRTYRPLPTGLFQAKLQGSWWRWGLGGYLVALPLMLGISLLNQQFWDGQGGSNPLLQTVLEEQDPVALLLFLATAAIAAPVFEEILFRGFLLPSLTRYLPVWGAIGLSSLIFAAAHLSLSEVLPLTLLGMVLGFVYTRSRNLLAPMLLHSAWNSVTMVGLFILGSG